jgi:C-terminal processing protease CtpA/Prc
MPEKKKTTRDEADRMQLRITSEEARRVAALLRYAVSLNTTVGLVSPTQRRLATSTYKAAELAAQILEGKTFDEAIEESDRRWTGSLEVDHEHALAVLQKERDTLREAMSDYMTPEQLAEYFEVAHDQFLELVSPKTAKKGGPEAPEG